MDIVAITSMRNEGPHCLEWIAHHLAAGVGHFIICTNDCEDGTDALMERLAQAGIVTHLPLEPRGKRPVQWQALKLAAGEARLGRADWAWVGDCDEFLNLRAPFDSLPQMIAALPEGTDAMAMPWRLFGSSGHLEMSDAATCMRFARAAPVGIALPLASFFKSLFRPSAFRQLGVHRPKRRQGQEPAWVDGSGVPLPAAFSRADQRINLFGISQGADLVQLNHYSLRAAENFMVKRSRGLPNHAAREVGLGYWVERNFNTVEDSSIGRMGAATRARLAQLLALDGVADLQAHARSWHRAKFQEMMQERDEIQLFWHLALSGGSTAPSPELAQAQMGRIARAMGNDE